MADPIQLPGAAFYAERQARARAVPPERRSPCVRAFLTADTLLCEAADVLPPAPGVAARGSADEQLVAQIKLVQAGMGMLQGQPFSLWHPRTYRTDFMAAQSQPLVRLLDKGDWKAAITPDLQQMLERTEPVADARTLAWLLALVHSLARLLTLVARGILHETAFRCLDLVERSLMDTSAAAAIDRQLAALRAGPAARSAAEDWQLPTAEGLHAMALHMLLSMCLAVISAGNAPLSVDPRARYAVAARQLAQLRPLEPATHFRLGIASFHSLNAGPYGVLRLWRHSLQLARQQGNLALTAALGYALVWAEYQLRPARGVDRALVEEADAAMAACKALLPEQWVAELRGKRFKRNTAGRVWAVAALV